MTTHYSSEARKNEILHLYDEKLAALNLDYIELSVSTSFGHTHIIVSGAATNPPIFLLHGSNGCAPIALETYPNLHRFFRVYAIDVLAQPNKSAATRLSMKDHSYGQWINELIDHLNLDQVTMAGFSLGGLAILKTLEFDERRIKEVFLSAPAYLVNGNPLKALFKVFIPMKRYQKTKDLKYVKQFLNELFTESDPFALEFLAKVFLFFDMDFTPVPVIHSKKAAAIQTPITIFAAKDDLLFPGKKMLRRAAKIFPSLKYTELLDASKHVQSAAQNETIVQRIVSQRLQ